MCNDLFLESAKACLANGQHLLEDAEYLENSDPPSTTLALAAIAQEEFAKGFLLVMAARGIIPWNSLIYRAARDHICKQLLGIVMEYVNPDSDLFLEQMEMKQKENNVLFRLLEQVKRAKSKREKYRIWSRIDGLNRLQRALPCTVADAISILRHEKVGRRKAASNCTDNLQYYDPIAKMTAKGMLDREKQDALYVDVSHSGQYVNSPLFVHAQRAKNALGRAKRLGDMVTQLVGGNTGGLWEYEKIESVFKSLFAENESPRIVRKRKEPSS